MRISDWSSDVCSSDLHTAQRVAERQAEAALERFGDEGRLALAVAASLDFQVAGLLQFLPVPDIDSYGFPFALGGTDGGRSFVPRGFYSGGALAVRRARKDVRRGGACPGGRSDEHTSDLQSLMRISYAVFCLKKTTTHLH